MNTGSRTKKFRRRRLSFPHAGIAISARGVYNLRWRNFFHSLLKHFSPYAVK